MGKPAIKPVDECAEDRAGPGRPRCPQAHAMILKAAQEILVNGGHGALTMEAVAKKAGVAKTTIYRWWPSRGALAMDVFLAVVEKSTISSQDGSAIDDLKQQFLAMAKLFRGNVGRAVAATLAESLTDENTRTEFLTRYMQPRRAAARILYERGLASGEIRKDIDPEIICDTLYGPLCMRLILRHAPLSDDAVLKIWNLVVDGLRPNH